MPIQVTDQTFEEVVEKSQIPVLIDFYGPNCVNCTRLTPFIDRISEQYQGRIIVVTIDASDQIDIALKYDVYTVPTVVLYHQTQVVDSFSGFPPNPMLKITEMINRILD
jgi:thioredoxin 1